ncbi:TPA: hypothetical protein LEL88_003489 [Vibrio cholerae]|uniref:Uncharacterized protein n=28 Tax=Gammaproteobacteria TaxID=1236 RepID=H9L4S7_VIBCH|nr:hypothetical protein [Vibrio cholerae]EAZ74660.1 hypothetical protein A5C_A0569 [Vibrio cholerae NCTC 8457]EYC46463.1 hypothetical protein AZ32_20705 [Vibrio cholerae O1 biovar El Tor str. L-3226]MDG6208181.1 hypothetical protein [Vibrio sp. NO3-D2]AAF96356.1 hypothetical protein VC_A0451 [Vibrio cholerae O1 biovar El Tor str. N16961]ABQ18948.1 hypothetical protein VC0395_0817 [Vibrio cholerae O395]
MKNIKYILFICVVAYMPFVSANLSHLDKSISLLNTLNYPAIFKNTLLKECDKGLPQFASLKICKQSETLSDEMIVRIAAKHFISYVSESDTDKLIAFWGGSDGVRISNGLVLWQQTGRLDVLTDTDLYILDKFNQTAENKASMAFADNVNVSVQIILEIEEILSSQ